MARNNKHLTREERIINKRHELAKSGKVAAIWTRVSSADQYRHNCSIESQIRGISEYCVRNNITIRKSFGGENESAKVAGEKFNDMLSEILNDPAYNCLIVFDYDRFSRADEAIVYKLKLKKAGISLISVNQPMDQNNILAEQIENILLIIANIDNAMRRHKCYSGMVDCVRRGELYSRPPLGYDSHKEGKKHVITLNEKGHILSNAFEWVVNEPHISQSEILRRLGVMGLKISKQKLSAVLHNSFYCGRLEHKYLNGEIVAGVQEPMISEAMFEQVQRVLSKNNSNYVHVEETPDFPLKRSIICAKDGHIMTGYKTKGNLYYKCAVKGCKTNVRASVVHDAFAELLMSFQVPEDFSSLMRVVIQRKFREKEGICTRDKGIIEKNISTIKTKLKTIKKRYVLGEIEKEDYNEVRLDLESDLAKAKAEYERYSVSFSNLSNYTDIVLSTCSQLSTYWSEGNFEICQKIQKLTFPDGIKWENDNQRFRTDGMNPFFEKIYSISDSYRRKMAQKKDKSCDLSCLVAEA